MLLTLELLIKIAQTILSLAKKLLKQLLMDPLNEELLYVVLVLASALPLIALCNDVTTARLSREHNDANVLALGARQTARELAEEIVDTFLATDFEGGRHAVRVAKIDETKFFLDSVDNTSNL